MDDEQRLGRDWSQADACSTQALEAIEKLDATTYVDLRIQVDSDTEGETELVIRCVILGEVGLVKPKNPQHLYLCSAADQNHDWRNLRQQSGDVAPVVTWTNSDGASEVPRCWLTTREQVAQAARVFVEEGRLAEVDGCLWA